MRIIDADYVKSKLNKSALGGHLHYYVCGVIDDAPTIDAEPVKHGYWIEKNDWIACSNCNHEILDDYYEKRYKYIACPHCGAKMDLKDGETK